MATVNAAGVATGVAAGGPATITASFGGQSGTAQLTVSMLTLSSIAVIPPQTTLAPGSSIVYQAVGTYNPGGSQVYLPATWSSSNTSIVMMNGAIATGNSAGPATIPATFGTQQGHGSVVVTASPLVSIAVTPASPNVPEGVAIPLTAVGTFADTSMQNLTSSVTWSSSAPSVATVSNVYPMQGLATGVGPGTSNITAVFTSVVSSPATLDVTTATLTSIAITPSIPTVTHGTAVQFTAKGTFSDNSVIDLTTQVTWTSSAATVATINSLGVANTASPGATNITASFTQNGHTTTGTKLRF